MNGEYDPVLAASSNMTVDGGGSKDPDAPDGNIPSSERPPVEGSESTAPPGSQNGELAAKMEHSQSMSSMASGASGASVESVNAATGEANNLASAATADSEENLDLPLHMAAKNFDVKSVEELVKLPNHTSQVDSKGRTALHVMVDVFTNLLMPEKREQYRKFIDILVALTRHGVSVNEGDRSGETVIHYAAGGYGCVEIIKPLVESRGHVNVGDKLGETPIHKAALEGLVENIGALIECGGDPNIRDHKGMAALHHSVLVKKNKEVIEYLLLHGATPNVIDKGRKTPLHTVTRARRHEYVEILCQHGARADMKDSSGQTALHVAATSDMTGKVLRRLLHFKANREVQDDIYSETPLHKAVKHNMIGNVKNLTSAKANPNAKDMLGETPLHKAAANSNMMLWQILLLCGGDVHAMDEHGVTPHQKALKNRNSTAIALMRQYGRIE